ncbi:hypothetical protein QW180_19655 [Vibrio sinaloensis]|nr:hypothetical protein [Vibrio sinaloensis]
MTLEEREQLLPKITYLLDQFPHIVSYSFFYYPTGDLFLELFISITKTVRQSLKVNPNTQYLLIHRKDEALYTKGLDREFLETHSVELDVARLLSDTPDWESLAANSSNKVSKPMHILGKDSLGITVFQKE